MTANHSAKIREIKKSTAVQNDTEIKFSIVLYIQVIFVGQG